MNNPIQLGTHQGMQNANLFGDNDCDSPKAPFAKRAKSKSVEWKVFDLAVSSRLKEVGRKVFFRPKASLSKQLGRRGKILGQAEAKRWTVYYGPGDEKSVSETRLLPVYDASTTKQLILVTADTVLYRQLAASQVDKCDSVLELGCSTGETSRVLWKYTQSWVGFDTSKEMIEATKEKLEREGVSSCPCTCGIVDALVDGDSALNIVKNHQQTSVVFLDIGGNREESGVLRMLEWVLKSFENLRMAIVKSEKVYERLKMQADDMGTATTGSDWFVKTLAESRALPTHPLQAPKVFSPTDNATVICRYHNYHADGCLKGEDCPYDHIHCHLCLEPGHVARCCPNETNKD